MTDAFLTRANERLMSAANLATRLENFDKALARELLAMVAVVRAAIDVVGDEGCLPASLCNAVVRYSQVDEGRR